ncbi:Hydantoin racemase [Gracilariopsis chorda]|uniref:Hydantoin racemase n=1 Tax=Gracilariopsis chorda TaxID=448386 RepID=A0A2V3IKF5_9FLOR|nr:Hydantoin racemase [Gracilariopsis chorda]|eukprot:PXF42528.1 Hydantoin racemase [Gracilariopsis chorda]
MASSTLAFGEKVAMAPLKLLWLNPVNTPDYDQVFANMIARVKLPNAEVHVMSLKLSPPIMLDNLEWRIFESFIWQSVAHMAHFAAINAFDGFAIGCFYDTAFEEAREVSGEAIVAAPCDASLKVISTVCNRFSVIIGVEKWKVQMEDRIRHYGYHEKLASFRTIRMHVDELQVDTKKTEEAIRNAVRRAKDEDSAEGVILGCTMEFGFYAVLQNEFNIPVIDAALACYKEMEHAATNKVQFGWKPSRLYSMEPPSKERLNKSGIFAGSAPIGNHIVLPKT